MNVAAAASATDGRAQVGSVQPLAADSGPVHSNKMRLPQGDQYEKFILGHLVVC